MAIDLGQECREQSGEEGCGALAGEEDVGVVDWRGSDAGGGVGDEREAEDVEAHVAGDDDLVDGGHADERGAEGAEGADFGGGFEGGAEDGEVDALLQRVALTFGFGESECAQSGGVGGGHVEEALGGAGAGGKAWLVGTEGGVLAGEVDVIGDEDEGAGREIRIDAAGGIGDDERAAAEEGEDAGREGDVGKGVALVGVDAALHDGDGCAGDGANHELAGVADDGGGREVRDVGVGDGDRVGDRRCEVAEARPEDDANAGDDRRAAADVGGCGLRARVEVRRALGRAEIVHQIDSAVRPFAFSVRDCVVCSYTVFGRCVRRQWRGRIPSAWRLDDERDGSDGLVRAG